jgi:hypothetical protein
MQQFLKKIGNYKSSDLFKVKTDKLTEGENR